MVDILENKILYEYQEIQYKELNDFLLDSSKKQESPVKEYFNVKWGNKFTPNGYCGGMVVNNCTYSILPKIEQGKLKNNLSAVDDDKNMQYLTFMFLKAYDVKVSLEDVSNSLQNQRHSIIDILIDLFCTNLLRELSKGVYREYIQIRDNIKALKGRWLLNHHFSKNVINDKVYCEFDEFSESNDINSIFMIAARNLTSNSPTIRKKLKQIEHYLGEVDEVSVDIENFKFQSNRLNKRFGISVQLALILLKHQVPVFSNKQHLAFCFLFKMHEVFEKFIANLLVDMKSLYESYEIQIQNSLLDRGNILQIRPDIVLHKDSKAKLIIDTKYKLFDKKPSQADLYQMYSYGMCYDFIEPTERKVLLLYPQKEENNIEQKEFQILGSNKDSIVNIEAHEIAMYSDNDHLLSYDKYIKEISNNLSNILQKYTLDKGN